MPLYTGTQRPRENDTLDSLIKDDRNGDIALGTILAPAAVWNGTIMWRRTNPNTPNYNDLNMAVDTYKDYKRVKNNIKNFSLRDAWHKMTSHPEPVFNPYANAPVNDVPLLPMPPNNSTALMPATQRMGTNPLKEMPSFKTRLKGVWGQFKNKGFGEKVWLMSSPLVFAAAAAQQKTHNDYVNGRMDEERLRRLRSHYDLPQPKKETGVRKTAGTVNTNTAVSNMPRVKGVPSMNASAGADFGQPKSVRSVGTNA